MSLIKKVSINTKKCKIREIYLFGRKIYEYIKISRYNKSVNKIKTYKFYSVGRFHRPKNNQRIFYLKVHRVHRTSFDCIRQWLDIAEKMNAFIYFVCDNPEMELKIKQMCLPNRFFAFIKSDRHTLKPEIKKILHKVERQALWERIAYSMITPFLHAQKNNYLISYNIDADDILLCINPQKISEAFKKAEKYAIDNKIDLLNFDMFYSKSYGVHWSFGIVICTNHQKTINTIRKNTNWRNNKNLIANYNICWIDKFNFNVDWLFTYFRDTKQLNMKTFYIDKGLVVHMPDIILEHGWAFMIQWENNEIKFPILTNLYDRKVWDTIQIPQNAIKIDVGLNTDDYRKFLCNFYDFGVGFEMDMLNYAKERSLISDDLYNKYAQTPQFIRECRWRKEFEEQCRNKKSKRSQ